MIKNNPETKVYFFDEGRFGLQPALGRRWARKGERPIINVKLGYENFYVFSAVCPTTGEDVSLFLPWVNTEMMNIFIEHLRAELNGRQCFLILDCAGWHNFKELQIPPNTKLVFLPPYSPELNPVERLWDWLKRNTIRNRFFQTLDEVMDSVEEYMRATTTNMKKSMCGCNYILYYK